MTWNTYFKVTTTTIDQSISEVMPKTVSGLTPPAAFRLLSERIERARANVPEHDAYCAQDQA
jgi:hypothetical protein